MSKSFEEQMEDLEKIVGELEKGDLNLDDSVTKFEEGIKISKECSKTLVSRATAAWWVPACSCRGWRRRVSL